MMFANLNMTKADGSGRMTKEDTDELAYQWREMLYTAGLNPCGDNGCAVTMYDIEEDKILFSMQRGWKGSEIKDFLLDQLEVLVVEWNTKKFLPPHVKALPAPERNAIIAATNGNPAQKQKTSGKGSKVNSKKGKQRGRKKKKKKKTGKKKKTTKKKKTGKKKGEMKNEL
jgi:hypothetical protein